MELAKRSAISDIELIENIRSEKRESTLDKVSKELNIPKKLIPRILLKTEL